MMQSTISSSYHPAQSCPYAHMNFEKYCLQQTTGKIITPTPILTFPCSSSVLPFHTPIPTIPSHTPVPILPPPCSCLVSMPMWETIHLSKNGTHRVLISFWKMVNEIIWSTKNLINKKWINPHSHLHIIPCSCPDSHIMFALVPTLLSPCSLSILPFHTLISMLPSPSSHAHAPIPMLPSPCSFQRQRRIVARN